jgi:separase
MDKFTMSVFDKIGLTKDRVAQWHRTTRNDSGNFNRAPATADSISIAEAIATSREVCKMDFLVGAAPVMYGVPFYI